VPVESGDVIIGKIVAPFGIRGEVKVVIHTDFPERFEAGRTVTLVGPGDARREARIARSTPNKGGVSVKFDGVDNRTDAEKLRGIDIVISESELGELGEDQFYVFDLIGMSVITDDGREQGEITEVLQGGANDVYVTSTGLCIPAIKDVVVSVDVDKGTMVIHPVPGLLPD
jgi:16S rRNA processing protein RimM